LKLGANDVYTKIHLVAHYMRKGAYVMIPGKKFWRPIYDIEKPTVIKSDDALAGLSKSGRRGFLALMQASKGRPVLDSRSRTLKFRFGANNFVRHFLEQPGSHTPLNLDNIRLLLMSWRRVIKRTPPRVLKKLTLDSIYELCSAVDCDVNQKRQDGGFCESCYKVYLHVTPKGNFAVSSAVCGRWSLLKYLEIGPSNDEATIA
jgi:hypothetical protein